MTEASTTGKYKLIMKHYKQDRFYTGNIILDAFTNSSDFNFYFYVRGGNVIMTSEVNALLGEIIV